ncbi:hypothetical protein ACTFIY_003412 [Dictyostelium cf. discoideum]
MNKNWFGGFLNNVKQTSGSSSGGSGVNNVSVEPLMDKIQDASSTIEAKKEAVTQLSSINRSCHQAVGARMSVLTNLLEQNKDDIELVREIIQILTLIMTTLPKDDNIIEIHNTELFISVKSNFVVICDLLKVNDYYIRYYIARFLVILIKNRFDAVQEAILSCPMSMPNIMSLLLDKREVIRNEALLIILELTKSNQEIQKIVAFESAFEILLDIIKREGLSEGGVIVNDCILVLNNLLKGNVSNQNFFRETGCIQGLSPLLEVQNTDMWILSDNKFNIIMSTLDIILTLVERNNVSTPPNQHVISHSGIMNLIIRLGLGKMSSQVIRSKSLYTLGEIIHLNPENISEFSGVTMKSEVSKQSQTALLRLTTVMLYSKDIIEKAAAFHVFKSYLYNNEEAQMALASTIISDSSNNNNNNNNTTSGDSSSSSSSSNNTNSKSNSPIDQQQRLQLEFENLSIGQHLYKALFSWETPIQGKPFDISCFWFASVVLLYMLKDSIHTKEQLLKMPLEVPKSSAEAQQPVTLFTKLMACLMATKKQDIDPTIKIGLLKLLAVWLADSPKGIKIFFDGNQHLAFLVEIILSPLPTGSSTIGNPNLHSHIQGLCTLILGICAQYMDDETAEKNKSNLSSIINHRITVNTFKEKLDSLRKSDSFTNAEQGEESFDPSSTAAKTIILYDFDFTMFFKDVYDKIRHIGTNINKPRPGKRPQQPTTTISTTQQQPQQPSQQQQQPQQQSPPQSSSPLIQQKYDHTTPNNNNNNNVSSPQSPPIQTVQQLDNSIEFNNLKKVNNELIEQLTGIKLQYQQLQQHSNQQQQLHQNQLQQLQQQLSTQVPPPQSSSPPQQTTSGASEQELLQLLEDKDKEISSLSDAVYKLEDIVVAKDDQIEEINNAIGQLKQQLQQSQQQQQQQQSSSSSSPFGNGGNGLDSSDYFELLRLRQENEPTQSRIRQLENEVSQLNQKIIYLTNENQLIQQQKEDALKKITSSPTLNNKNEPNSLKLAKLEGELSEMKIKYESLIKEQDEVLSYSTKIELENSNLKNQLSKLQQ